MSDIYLTGDELREIEGRHMVGTYQSLYRDIANAASEKAQRVTAWEIVDKVKSFHTDKKGLYGGAFDLLFEELIMRLEQHLRSQGIKREG